MEISQSSRRLPHLPRRSYTFVMRFCKTNKIDINHSLYNLYLIDHSLSLSLSLSLSRAIGPLSTSSTSPQYSLSYYVVHRVVKNFTPPHPQLVLKQIKCDHERTLQAATHICCVTRHLCSMYVSHSSGQ